MGTLRAFPSRAELKQPGYRSPEDESVEGCRVLRHRPLLRAPPDAVLLEVEYVSRRVAPL
jgi:hypothetical protein